MAARGWWWQRIHPVPRVLLAAAYFGGAVIVFVLAITPGLGDAPPEQENVAAAQPPESTLPTSTLPAEPPTAAELFATNCASCHGSGLEGGAGPALGRGSDAADEIDRRIRLRINDGRNDMPGFADKLSEEEVELLLGFLREQQS